MRSAEQRMPEGSGSSSVVGLMASVSRWTSPAAFLAGIYALAICSVFSPVPPAAAEVHRLRVGIAIGADEAARERIEPFRVYLEERLDLPVDLYLIDTLGELAEALSKGDVDYGRLSSSAYAAAFTACECLEPLATASPDAFPPNFYSVLVAKDRQPGATIAELKGGRVGIGDPNSVSGYLVPLANLAAEGVEPKSHFSAMVRVKDPVDGLQAVVDGRLDAAFAWSTLNGEPSTGYDAGTLNDFYVSGRPGFSKLQIVWRSLPIPYNAHVVQLDLPDELKRALRGALIGLRDEAPDIYMALEPDLPGGLQPVVHADYRAVLRAYSAENRGGFEEAADVTGSLR